MILMMLHSDDVDNDDEADDDDVDVKQPAR